VVEDLVENGYADFEEFRDLNEDELAEKIKEKYLLMQKNYNNNFEKICQKSELTLINESKNIDV
jgi:polyhydroxyalkanoate synthesis regulator phasin